MPEQLNKTEEVALRLMRVLEATPAANQRELAERSGMSLGSLNYCLKALMSKGLLKMQNFALSQNKLGYVYVLTPIGMAEKADITRRFLRRKQQEYEALKAEIEVLQFEVEKSGRQGTQKA
jgi:EPS-associated MarR family transcriptional regulator